MSVAGLTIGTGRNEVLYIILGTNIGSCVTALMSSFGASPNAKRASLIHLLFNVFGSVPVSYTHLNSATIAFY